MSRDGWLAEEAAVFAIELAGTFVSDFEGRTGGVETIDEHASARCLQAQLLLILQRTHGGQRAEMMVQRGHAHSRDFREIFHSQRLGVVCPDPRDGFCGAMALISQRCDRAQARALRPAKNSVNDFALNQTAEKGMSCGVSSRSTSRQQASRNSAVVSPVAMAGLVSGGSAT